MGRRVRDRFRRAVLGHMAGVEYEDSEVIQWPDCVRLPTGGLESPLFQSRESGEALQTRLEEYTRQAAAGLSLFQNFFRIAGVAALAPILLALAMRVERRRGVTQKGGTIRATLLC